MFRFRGWLRTLVFFWLTFNFSALCGAQPRLVLSGASVIDGTGTEAFQADLSLVGGRIGQIGRIVPQAGDRVIRLEGKIIAPGFVDLHNHSAWGLLAEPQARSQVSQGITTLVLGPDGGAPFPTGHFLEKVEERGTAVNVALMVGHGTVRSAIMDKDYRRQATRWEIEAMAALVEVAMKQGAFGLSSGLEYDPGYYSSTSELITLARVVAEHDGIYMSHIRDEEDGFVDALSEAIEIGRQARLPVQVSHLKLGNKRVWGRTAEVLNLLHEARHQGIDIRADCYPYNAWASGLSILVPNRRFEDREEIGEGFAKVGGAEKVMITRYDTDPSFEFKNMKELAEENQTDPVTLFIEMMKNGGASVVCESMNQEDVDTFYRDPLVMVASDGGIDSRHPRKTGTFTRVLGRYVRERKLLSWTEAIHKMTALPAARLGLSDRGRIQAGLAADLVVFDPQEVSDRSTFQQPDLLSQGIVLTIVNGEIVWEDGQVSGQLPGLVLRKHSLTGGD